MSKETVNWLNAELLAVSEHVKEKGGYSSRNGMLRQLVVDKALELGIVDANEHRLLSMMAHNPNRGGDA